MHNSISNVCLQFIVIVIVYLNIIVTSVTLNIIEILNKNFSKKIKIVKL